MKKTLSDVIDKIGGSAFVAYKLGCHQTSVDGWLLRGVPSKYWRRLVELSGGELNLTELLDINEEINSHKRS